jgi:hypothetical protein
LKNFTFIKVAHWCENVIDRICLSHSPKKWPPFQQDEVISDTPENAFTVEPCLANSPVNQKKLINNKEF